MDLRCCGMCCGIFSSFAIVFLVIVSSAIKSGTDSITLPIVVNQTAEAAIDRRHEIAANCLVGAGIYGGCCLLSVVCCFYRKIVPVKKDDDLLSREFSLN